MANQNQLDITAKPSQGGNGGTTPAGATLSRTFAGHTDWIRSVAFDLDGKTLASGSSDGSIKLWNSESGELLRTLEGHSNWVWSVAFDSHGGTLASAGGDRVVKLWNAETGELLQTFKGHQHSVNAVVFRGDGCMLASASHDHTVKLWDTTNFELIRTFNGHSDIVLSVAFHPEGTMVASSGYDATVLIWDAISGKVACVLNGHKGWVSTVAFIPSGQTLASGSADGTVKLWDAASGQLLRTLEGHTSWIDSVAFSCDGKLLASRSMDGTIRIWCCTTWETLAVIPEPSLPGWWTPALAFHPTLPLLATAGSEPDRPDNERCRLIHIWKLDLDVPLGTTNAESQSGRLNETVCPARFERIRVQGFRRLHDVDLRLKSLNVMIGANGSGKTSLLDVFELLSASASGQLKETISDLGGVEGNLTTLETVKPGKTTFMRFEIDAPVADAQPLKYAISLKSGGVSYEIVDEVLTQQRNPSPPPLKYIQSHHGDVRYFKPQENKLWPPEWKYEPLESALSQVPKMYQAPEDFRNVLASATYYHVLDVGPRAPVRLPQQMREAKLPGKDGEDLVSCLFWMREADPDRFEAISDTLRAGFPDFDRLNFPPVAAGTLAMTWKDRKSKYPFYMHQLSEGTLRFLWLATLLQSPGLTAITLIDEPEVSLHPELLSLLAELMREASQRTQLIVATHADRLVRFLKPDEVIAVDIADDGTASATWADEFDLNEWLTEYTLDEVWRLGRIGGRP